MKKLLFILLSALSLTAFAQQKKTVAVLDPICRDNSVNGFFQQMVRGAMESAVTTSLEYEAYDRSAFDQIQKEQAFQRTGAVSDSQIKRMGELAGVDYVLVSEVTAYEGYLSAIVKILNVTTGKYDRSVDDYAQLNPEAVKTKCREMASSLFGAVSASNSNNQTVITKKTSTPKSPNVAIPNTPVTHGNVYVDLGLPSGTLWKAENESCGMITYDKAMSLYGNNLPSQEQCEELIAECTWVWADNGYNVTGPNGKTIFFPAEGLKGGYTTSMNNIAGYYWTSQKVDTSTMTKKEARTVKMVGGMAQVYSFSKKEGDHAIGAMMCGMCLSIRLVK